MISIVIPLYNKEAQIRNTLQSVFNQTFQAFEIIIVNDGSTDKSVDVVNSFNDERIKIINQANQGVSVARNMGIQNARYELIALLDGDDEWKPEYLESQINLIEKFPDCDIFICGYDMKQGQALLPTEINRILFTEKEGVLTNYFEAASCSHPPICSINIVARKHTFLTIGGFPLEVTSGEDLLTWAKLAVRYKIAYNKTPLATFILDESHSSASKPRRIPSQDDIVGRELKRLLDDYATPGLGAYISMWHKMRASVFLRINNRRLGLSEIFKAIKYNKGNVKLYIYLLLAFSPRVIQRKALKFK